mmetsp:Transcript_18355/g.28185  ORF Transcript_18355/g.28185 Transcript_18355/m.28185 type:complete len:86 (+) Transcript_18355:773-1030(+)|eukprot:CAMPEP_0170503384 /NCGR_PEP_ID=MMETSP0208-20121228/44534_1 /TAXON_ID=197538 /ORGANISM="Strombidium inclinatum, Strain S3" /LENGTH=85 /DNA_ID=CAMNT_0010782997 /DNA_START=839 /DNA_END=1096 /DNA_ORIENTATION=+
MKKLLNDKEKRQKKRMETEKKENREKMKQIAAIEEKRKNKLRHREFELVENLREAKHHYQEHLKELEDKRRERENREKEAAMTEF